MNRNSPRKFAPTISVFAAIVTMLAISATAASLMEVIESDDVPAIEQKLASGTDPGLRYEGIPILVLAAVRNSWGVVRSLLNAGANPNNTVPFTHDNTLFYAAEEGKLSIVKLLIEKGAEVDIQRRAIIHVDSNLYARTDSGNTPLTIAVVKGKKDVAVYLLSRGADPNKVVVYEDVPLKLWGNPYTMGDTFTVSGVPGLMTHKSGSALQVAFELKHREWLPAAVDSIKAASSKP